MIFAVDAKTEITARGATTKTQAAQAAGKAGTTISALLKVGDGVEVRYSNVDGKMLASSIRANQPVGAGGISSSKPVAMTTEGIVTAVTMSSLAIKSGDRAMTFVIDKATDVTARGASTLQRQKQAEGAKGLIITEIVRVGDTVTVSYHDMEGKMHAATVRVMPKK
jgi:hypothetical protein